jgi:hypothetical protein
LRNSSSSLATFTAIRRASSRMRGTKYLDRYLSLRTTSSCWPLWSRTTKQAACFSTDQGGGKRRSVASQLHVSWATHLWFHHCQCGGVPKKGVPTMRIRREKENRFDWRFNMEHIGRELRKLYPPADMPPGLHALFTEERRRAREMRRKDQRVRHGRVAK